MHIIRKLFPHQRQHGADNGVRLFPADKQKILAAFSQRDPFSIVDLMGVHDDVTLRSLTEDPGQLYHIKGFGRDQITQDVDVCSLPSCRAYSSQISYRYRRHRRCSSCLRSTESRSLNIFVGIMLFVLIWLFVK